MPAADEIRIATTGMWLKWQEVSVFCPVPVHEPSLYFAQALQKVIWQKPDSTDVSRYLNKSRGDLFEVAGPIFREQRP